MQRNCSKCNKIIEYKTKSYFNSSIKNNLKCKSCANKQPDNWIEKYGKKIGMRKFELWKIKMSDATIGKSKTEEHNRNVSIGMKNKWKDEEYRIKNSKSMRLGAIKRIERNLGHQLTPNFNLGACKIIDEYGQAHNYAFQHAMNGGEFHIKKLGYWVDGYDKNKNVVIEYYENQHKKIEKKDAIRKNEIINYLGCKFIEIKEWEMQ